MSKRGVLIVVEGCDRAGKSTQCQRLVDKLNKQNKPAKLLKFPDRTTQMGIMIDSYLKQSKDMDDHVIHLLFSANRWEAVQTMETLLSQGTTLIVDRYAFSGVAFSAAKGLDRQWCQRPDVGLLTPDLVLFLDLPIDLAEKRGGFGEERYEQRELQVKVRDEFMALKDQTWKIVDASQSMEKVEEVMWEHVLGAVKVPPGELRHDLWKTMG